MSAFLTAVEKEIIKLLFFYRGLTADDVAAFRLMSNTVSVSIQKSTYNILRRLVNKKLVYRQKSIECEYTIYKLSPKGLLEVKKLLNVSYNSDGNGLLPVKEDTTFWDVPYSIYSPPRYQLGHYLMSIACIRQLIPLFDRIRLQTAYYSNLSYSYNGKSKKVKPDFAVIINDNFYAIEVDTGTESKNQLFSKFLNYKYYCDYQNENKDAKKVHTILFVVPNLSEANLNRRWITVLEAFYKAFDQKLNTPLNLIFVTQNDLLAGIKFEIDRERMMSECKNNIRFNLEKEGYNRAFNYQLTLDTGEFSIYLNDDSKKFKPVNIMLNQPYETKFFYDKYTYSIFENRAHEIPFPTDKHFGYKCDIKRVALGCLLKKPVIPVGLNKSDLSEELKIKLNVSPELCEKFEVTN